MLLSHLRPPSLQLLLQHRPQSAGRPGANGGAVCSDYLILAQLPGAAIRSRLQTGGLAAPARACVGQGLLDRGPHGGLGAPGRVRAGISEHVVT
jgi:hypothetical protein